MKNSPWSTFEKRIVQEPLIHGVYVCRVPSDMRKVGPKVFRKKTGFDFAAGVSGRAVFFDAKACEKNSFYLQSYVLDPKKIHQYEELRRAKELGNMAGYLIWLYKKQLILWADITLIQTLVEKKIRSLDEETEGVTIQRDDVPLDLNLLLGVPRGPNRLDDGDVHTRKVP